MKTKGCNNCQSIFFEPKWVKTNFCSLNCWHKKLNKARKWYGFTKWLKDQRTTRFRRKKVGTITNTPKKYAK